MRCLKQKEYFYTIGKYNKPTLTVKRGETIAVDTADNTGNLVKTEEDRKILPTLKNWNPLSGPISVEGDPLHLGDVHAIQGDGELNGSPVEIAAECTLTLEVIKNKAMK